MSWSKSEVVFGQVVIGPPGSGKSTYCNAMSEFLRKLGRETFVVNLDPGNDVLPYACAADVLKLVSVVDVMEEFQLGPNGALLYCMEYLEKNFDWLLDQLAKARSQSKRAYFLFDCPGQVELYTHHNSLKNILKSLEKHDYRLVNIHLVDSHYCTAPEKYVFVLLTSLASMVQLEMPHLNVLSKIDLIEAFGELPLPLDYFCEVLNLQHTVLQLEDHPFLQKYKALTSALAGVIEDYGLVSFTPLNIQDKEMMLAVSREADKANGYCFGAEEEQTVYSMFNCAMSDVRTGVIEKADEKYRKSTS